LDSSQFDLIYVDPPPFNQYGSDPDHSKSPYHSFQEYLEYVVFVLYHSKRLLKDSGSILFRMDPASPLNSRLFLDRIFRKQNYQAEVIWERRVIGSNLPTPHLNYDSVFFYSKSDDFTYHELQVEERARSYNHYDDKGFYRLLPLIAPINRPNMSFPWRDRKPPQNSSWKYSIEKLDQLYADGLIDWSGKLPRRKVYESEQSSISAMGFVWRDDSTRGSKKSDPRMQNIINMTSDQGHMILVPFLTSSAINSFRYSGRNWAGIDLHNETKFYTESKSLISQIRQVNTVQDLEVIDGSGIPEPLFRLIVSEARALNNNIMSELSGQRFALLVGINNYKDGIKNLQYCINDVLLFRTVIKMLAIK
jgi:DNA modification methylase